MSPRTVTHCASASTDCEASTSVYARSDKSMDFVPLALIDHRTEDNFLLSRVSDGQMIGGGSEALDVGIGNAFMDEVTAGGHTDLTLMHTCWQSMGKAQCGRPVPAPLAFSSE